MKQKFETFPEKPAKEESDIEVLEKVLKKLDTNREFKPEELEKWADGFNSLNSVLGKNKTEELIDRCSRHLSGDLHYFFSNFTRSGWEAAKDFFGEERVRSVLENRADLFSFHKEQFEELAQVLGDQRPYDETFRLLSDSYPRPWLENIDLLKKRKSFMAPEEFRAVLNSPDTRGILISDGRRQDWPVYLGREEEGIYGMEKNLSAKSVITKEKWQKWRELFGSNWLAVLALNPSAEILNKVSPDNLSAVAPLIPDIVERAASEPDAIGFFDLFLLLEFQENPVAAIERIFSEFTETQKKILLSWRLGKLGEFLEWQGISNGKFIFQALRKACSPKYIETMLSETDFSISGWGSFIRVFPLDAEDEAMQKPLEENFQLREKIDSILNQDEEIRKFLIQNPQSAPYLRLRYADALDRKFSKEVAILSAQELVRQIAESQERYDENLIPSVGVEIEVIERLIQLKKPKRKREEYLRPGIFGIPAGHDELWEFSMEPTDLSAQARLISELIRGGWIDPEQMGEGNYTLHLNFGIPAGVEISQSDAGFLTYLLTATYVNNYRLREGNYGTIFEIHTRRELTNRGFEPKVGNKVYAGRIEMRTFSVEKNNIFRLLFDAAMIGGAFFAAQSKDLGGDKKAALAGIWRELEAKVKNIFEKCGVDWRQDHFGYFKSSETERQEKINRVLESGREIGPLAREASRKIRQIARKAAARSF